MTTKLEQAARQALEALNKLDFYSDGNIRLYPYENETEESITALREALAEQAEQEPVFYHAVDKFGCNRFYYLDEDRPTDAIPLYAAPVRTKDLTDDEIGQIWACNEGVEYFFARAVIAADREKNK